jgi:hypothetical protein
MQATRSFKAANVFFIIRHVVQTLKVSSLVPAGSFPCIQTVEPKLLSFVLVCALLELYFQTVVINFVNPLL